MESSPCATGGSEQRGDGQSRQSLSWESTASKREGRGEKTAQCEPNINVQWARRGEEQEQNIQVLLADFQSDQKGLSLLEQMGPKLFSAGRAITGCICLEGTSPG